MRSDIGRLVGVLIFTEEDRHEAMEVFYVDVLGLVPRSRRPGFVNFAWGDLRLTIATHSEVSGPARDPRRVMINLAVEDIDAAARQLAGSGVDFIRPPEYESWGGYVATFRDPDGNLVQLLQMP